ncbi:MAG TPA: glycoside hydrolase family 32 protein [Leadbetterella sp.]|nr:glycoside hydrolase family 32 protein [Leadbetterella sp.]
MKNLILCLFLVMAIVQSFAQDFRPNYHYTPPKNWVNDPNGLVYLDGEYHLFYQYNPFGDKWGHMSWGHAVSKDLVKWETLPLALPEIQNGDGSTTMIFSGCVVVDSFNTSGLFKTGFKKGLVAVFTSHVSKPGQDLAQHQSLAYSSDKGRTWKYFDKNPVLDIGLTNFRDPNVIWWPSEKKWIMTVVKPLEYLVQFYSSKDLKKWSLMSEFGKQGDMTRIWECPALFKVPVQNSTESKWVLMLSSGNRQPGYLGMQYFVGDFDGNEFKSQKQSEVLYVDEGKDFYAAIPYYNLPKSKKNPIIIGWINDWEYANDIPLEGYRGGFSVARKLSLYKTLGIYKIMQEPVVSEKLFKEELKLSPGYSLNTKLGEKTQNSYALNLEINLGNSAGFDLKLLKTQTHYLAITYDVATHLLLVDRTQSGLVDFNKRFPSVDSVKIMPENNKIRLKILVDKSIVEIYANNGKVVLTDYVFPLSLQTQETLNWR